MTTNALRSVRCSLPNLNGAALHTTTYSGSAAVNEGVRVVCVPYLAPDGWRSWAWIRYRCCPTARPPARQLSPSVSVGWGMMSALCVHTWCRSSLSLSLSFAGQTSCSSPAAAAAIHSLILIPPIIHSLSCRYNLQERPIEARHRANGARRIVARCSSRQRTSKRARWRWWSKVGSNLHELPPSKKTSMRRLIRVAITWRWQQPFSAFFSHAPDRQTSAEAAAMTFTFSPAAAHANRQFCWQ